MHSSRVSKLTLACSFALACTAGLSVNAQAATLAGKVTNQQQAAYFSGASLTIKELGITTTSRSDGSYRFDNVPAGEYTLEVNYLGFAPLTQQVVVTDADNAQLLLKLKDERSIEDMVVFGQRAGQAGAINAQKNADGIMSVVSADAIGQFPDQNVSEALQRLPGLSIERDQGEGRFVGIRGIDPNLNNVTINGVNVPSPEAGVRSVALDVIPSNLVGSLVVSKSVTPDMDADAIGGSVEVKSLSGFDRAQQSFTLSGQLAYNELREQTSPKVEASYTDVMDLSGGSQLGIAGALSASQRKFGSDNIESNGDDEIEQRYYQIQRDRLGAALNLDFRPDFNNQYFLRTLYSRFNDDEYRQANTFTFDDESEIERGSKDREETQEILSVTAGGEHQLADSWQVNYQLGFSRAKEENPHALYYTLKAEELAIDSDMQGKIPEVTVSDEVNDFANYELDEISDESEYAKDTEVSLKLDISKHLQLASIPTEIKFGGKYRQREKSSDAIIEIYDGGFDGIDVTSLATTSPDWSLGDFGPGLGRSALRDSYHNNADVLELADLDSEVESKGASYRVDEDILAAYLMATMDIDKLRLVYGLRYERTDFSTQGYKVSLIEDEEADDEYVDASAWNADRSYGKVLPSVNARYAFSDKLIGRAAYTQTLSRPKFEDAAAWQLIEASTEFDDDEGVYVTEREAEAGNPELKPYFAHNIDLSLEYYPGNIGVLSVGYFHKEIDNFVIVADVAGTSGWEGYEEVYQPINGDKATLDGIEVSWVKSFDSGLLLSANGTFTDSEATSYLDGEEYKTRLPNQSDTIANLTIGYESNDWSLRLTGAYKSKNLEEIDDGMLRYEQAHTQIDFSAKYYLNAQTHIYFNGVNLNDEPLYHYFDTPSKNAQYETYGSTFELGISWASF